MKKIITLLAILLVLGIFTPAVYAQENSVNLNLLNQASLNALSSEPDKVDRIWPFTLTKDTDLATSDSLVIPSNCSIEINLNGFKLYNTLLDNNNPLIINNGVLVIRDDSTSGAGQIYNNTSSKNAVILNKNIFGVEKGAIINKSTDSNANALVTGYYGLTNDCKVFINGGSITSAFEASVMQIGYSNQYSNYIRINNGTINTLKTSVGGSQLASIDINGGTIDGILDIQNTNCVISNALLKEKVDDKYIATFYKQSNEKDNGYYIVTSSCEAVVGDSAYNTLKDAMNVAHSKNDKLTIKLLKDVYDDDLDVLIESNETLDLCGHSLTVNKVSFFGFIDDSSEEIITNDDIGYYCRPQGKLTQLYSNKLTYLGGSKFYVGDGHKLAALTNGSYKFYTLTSFDLQQGKTTDKEGKVTEVKNQKRMRPIIGFKPNSVWKDILTESTNIRLAAEIKSNISFGQSATTDTIGCVYYMSTGYGESFASGDGYGTYYMSMNGVEKDAAWHYTLTPVLFDEYNHYYYYDVNSATESFNE